MPGYKLTITNSEGSIDFSTSEENNAVSISSVTFKMNTLNDETRNRSDAVRAEMVICGLITTNNKDKTHKLLAWAVDSNQSTLYRNVRVEVNSAQNNTGDVLRVYDLKDMFVIDYEEFPNKNKAEYMDFKLFIAQKEDAYDGITTSSF